MTEEKENLIRMIQAKGISSPEVLEAIRQVDRSKFVPDSYKTQAFADRPLPIGLGQTISQPFIVALMTEMLEIKKSDRVLEVGTGSGYQLAVLLELGPDVYSVEKSEELIEVARKNLAAAGYRNYNIKNGDGYEGWEEMAPFDRIIVTAAAIHVPPPLIDQLAAPGRMIIPVGGKNTVQQLRLIVKDSDAGISTHDLEAVRFVPMLGKAQKKNTDSD